MPNIYGFRCYLPRAAVTTHPFTGATIATPVLDLSSVLGPAGYADRSATGANGVPAGAPNCARGVYGNAIKFGGVRDTLNCGSNAPLDIAANISVFCWVNESVASALSALVSKTDGASGWYLGLNALSRPQAYFYAGGGATLGGGAGAVVAQGRWTHTGFSVVGTVGRLFVDGLEFARGAVTMSDAAASSLYIGSGSGAGNWENGLIELVQEWNGALTPEQAYARYLEAKCVPICYDDFSSYSVTFAARPAGATCGPFRLVANTANITVDANGQKWVNAGALANTDMVAQWSEPGGHGTWEFDVLKTAAGTQMYFMPLCTVNGAYTAGGQTGYMFLWFVAGAVGLARVTAGAIAAYFNTSANGWCANGTAYRVRIVRRTGGRWWVYTKGGAYPDFVLTASPEVENTYTSARFFNLRLQDVNDKLSNIRYSRVCERPESFPWEYVSGTYVGLVSNTNIWMRCLTAGISFQPHDAKPGVYEFGVYKGADANVTDTLFCTELLATVGAAQNGYCVRLSADERLQLIRMDAGVETVLAQTAAAYVALTTEYRIKIVRTLASTWSIYIVGGAYTSWTLAVGPTTDATYLSTWYLLHDLDADDRVTAPQYKGGE